MYTYCAQCQRVCVRNLMILITVYSGTMVAAAPILNVTIGRLRLTWLSQVTHGGDRSSGNVSLAILPSEYLPGHLLRNWTGACGMGNFPWPFPTQDPAGGRDTGRGWGKGSGALDRSAVYYKSAQVRLIFCGSLPVNAVLVSKQTLLRKLKKFKTAQTPEPKKRAFHQLPMQSWCRRLASVPALAVLLKAYWAKTSP